MKSQYIFLPGFLILVSVSPLFTMCRQFNLRKPGVVNEDVIIKTSEISEYALFYPFEIDGFSMEIIAIKAPDKSLRTAFNACTVCYVLGKGYYVQKGSVLVCQQCGNQFHPEDIEIKTGGCNPIPIFSKDKVQTASTIIISKEYLRRSKAMFEKMKEEAE